MQEKTCWSPERPASWARYSCGFHHLAAGLSPAIWTLVIFKVAIWRVSSLKHVTHTWLELYVKVKWHTRWLSISWNLSAQLQPSSELQCCSFVMIQTHRILLSAIILQYRAQQWPLILKGSGSRSEFLINFLHIKDLNVKPSRAAVSQKYLIWVLKIKGTGRKQKCKNVYRTNFWQEKWLLNPRCIANLKFQLQTSFSVFECDLFHYHCVFIWLIKMLHISSWYVWNDIQRQRGMSWISYFHFT